jgi:alkanesulfonate monooxygenase SsuD/methylene tetrahydromethanopterin reductase-like flavin-dependent oxidoreductase (luciferase family)
VSAPDVVLAAIAARTSRIGLGPAVAVLSSDDPVRVFQRYVTLDAASGGRVEIMLGRGSSSDSFPLFGFDLADYALLFEEKSQLLARLLKGGPVTWAGSSRAHLVDQDVVPHAEVGSIPAWICVENGAEWVVLAARHGYALILANTGDPPARGAPLARLFREALRRYDRPQLPVGILSRGHVAATDARARAEFWPHYEKTMRGSGVACASPAATEEKFLREIGPDGALYIGSPETVAQKIAATLRMVGATRFDLQYGMGGLPHDALLTNIRLYGTSVIPRVRALLSAAEREP